MARKKKKEAVMGRAIITLGIAFKLIQIIGAAAGLSALSGTVMTVLTTCFLVGGLAVLASENINITGAFALISLVGIIGGILPSESALFLFAFMAISIAAFGIMLITMLKKYRIACGVIVLLLCIALTLQMAGVISLSAIIITAVLICIYSVMGIGLYV